MSPSLPQTEEFIPLSEGDAYDIATTENGRRSGWCPQATRQVFGLFQSESGRRYRPRNVGVISVHVIDTESGQVATGEMVVRRARIRP